MTTIPQSQNKEFVNKTLKDYGINLPNKGRGTNDIVCPQCSHLRKKSTQPCLGVTYHESGNHFWGCNHCGFAGSVYKGITNSMTSGVANSMSVPAEYPKKVVVLKIIDTELNLPEPIIKWFKDRGISEEVLKKNKVSYGNKWMRDYGKETGVIKFPYMKDGVPKRMMYRAKDLDSGSKAISQEGSEDIPYGYDDINPRMNDGKYHKQIYITEGQPDKLTFNQIGINTCISVPSGAPSPTSVNLDNKFKFLESIEDILNNTENVVICVDNDEPGKKLEEELSRRIGREKCLRVEIPIEYKDINDVLVKGGESEAIRIIGTAKPYPLVGIYRLKDIEPEIDDIFLNGITPGLELPWNNIKDIYKMAYGEFTVVTGYPGGGKSEVVDSMVLHYVQEHNLKCGIFSPEHAQRFHFVRLAEKFIGKPMRIKLQGQEQLDFTDNKFMNQNEYQLAKKFINDRFIWIKPERKSPMTPELLLGQKQALVLRHGCRVFIDDPYNRLEHGQIKDKEGYVSWFLERYGEFNERFDTHSFLVAHPKGRGVDVRGKAQEGIYSALAKSKEISGGAMWENKSPNILSIGRQDIEHGTDASANSPVLFSAQKIKFKWNGKVGLGKLKYDKENGRYEDYV